MVHGNADSTSSEEAGLAAEEFYGDQQARIAALKEEKRKFVNSATEEDIRSILAQPSKMDAENQQPAPNKPKSLLEWAQGLEANGDISKSVHEQINAAHAAVDATGRLALIVAKDNDVLIRDFKLKERRQHLQSERTGERLDHAVRVVHNLQKAGLHREPQRADVYVQARAAFEVFDQDGDGNITREEFCSTMLHPKGAGVPLSQERADQLFDTADRDSSGLVDFEEFMVAFTQMCIRPPGWEA